MESYHLKFQVFHRLAGFFDLLPARSLETFNSRALTCYYA